MSCPIKPARVDAEAAPVVRVSVNEATPFTVVNLERSTVELVLTQVLAAFVPASAQIAELSSGVSATTVSASAYPVTHVRQVSHLGNPVEATALAAEIQKQFNEAVEKVTDDGTGFGKLIEILGKTSVLVAVVGSDVHVVMKPPLLVDIAMAQRKAVEATELDWTALTAPKRQHWEIAGSVGPAIRADVFARIDAVRVHGGGESIQPTGAALGALAKFEVPLGDSKLILYRNLKGQLKVDIPQGGPTPAELPALDLLNDRGELAAVLRLDLKPGDPRYDLARTRAVFAKRTSERKKSSEAAKKEVDEMKNAYERYLREHNGVLDFQGQDEWARKLFAVHRAHSMQRAAHMVLDELDNQASETQRLHPEVTLAPDDAFLGDGRGDWTIDRTKYPFAGRWLFDYGVLALHQDSSGMVAGVFASKVFHNTAEADIDQTKPATGLAIVSGKAKGSRLQFTMVDYQGRERKGTLSLEGDGASGKWTLDATTSLADAGAPKSPPIPAPKVQPNPKPQPVPKPKAPPSGKGKGIGGSPFDVAPSGASPFGLPPASPASPSPFGLGQMKPAPPKNAEEGRRGNLDRVEVARPDPAWTQAVATASAAGYWVHSDDKRMNILFRSRPNGLFEGRQSTIPGHPPNLQAAVSGQYLFVLENVNTILTLPSVREAVLANEGKQLRFIAPRDGTSASGLFGRNLSPLILTFDSPE